MSVDAEVFRRAASIMAERGQCKGTLATDSGQVCLYGALDVAVEELGGSSLDWGVVWQMADNLHAQYAPDYEPLDPQERAADWNDHPDRTQTEVEKFLLWSADRIDADEAGA